MRNIIIILLGLYLCTSCEEAEFTPYSGKDYVQFVTRNTETVQYEINFKWISVDSELDYDTIYLPIQTLGRIYDKDRYVMLKQELYLEKEFIYNELGAVIDTLIYASPNQAIEGVHYLPFNNPGIKERMKIHAGSFQSEIAIILKRDRVGEKLRRKLKIRIIDTPDILAGDPQATYCTINIE
ncbi:MAG: hypothetical protein RR397_00360 [Odoribacter sp.]